MKKFFNTIWCAIVGHKYALIRTITYSVREVKCKRCHAEFGMNDEAESILPLDADLRAAHDMMLPNAIKKMAKETAEAEADINNYNRLLKEAKVLQNKLELSTNLDRRMALDGRIREKVRQINQLAEHRPDILKPLEIN